MTVNAAVADVERAGDIDHRGLCQPKAAQHVLGSLENTLRRQDDILVHARTVILSCSGESDLAYRRRQHHLAGQPPGLCGKDTGHAPVQPALELNG